MKRFFILPAMVAAVLVCCPSVINAQTVTLLYHFTNTADEISSGPLVLGSGCNLYGATGAGGINTNGSIFSITTNGTFSTVYSFPGPYNANIPTPTGWLIQANDGSFYGTANSFNALTSTVFRVSTNGSLTTLCTLLTSAELPGLWGPISLGADGYIYGACFVNDYIFKVSTNGAVFTNLFQVDQPDGVPYGTRPQGGVVQGTDGNFYGTTSIGGTNSVCGGGGTVFQITSTGALVNIHAFGGYTEICTYADTDGDFPTAALVQGYDGNFYSTTAAGGDTNSDGAYAYGTIFQVSPSGAFATLHWFNGIDGADLGDSTRAFGLIQASDGNLYGVSSEGGNISDNYPNGLGTIFRISISGVFTTLYNFSESDFPVSSPYSLIQGPDGNFYGTGADTIFKLVVPLSSPPNQISAIQIVSTNVVVTVPTITGESYQLQYSSSLTTAVWANVSGAYVSNSLGGPLTLTDVGGAVNTQRFYQVEVTSCAGSMLTEPVGFDQLPLNTNADTLMVVPFTQFDQYRGTVGSVSGNVITDAGSPSWTAGQWVYDPPANHSTYYVIFTSGNNAGAYYTVTNNDCCTLSVNLSPTTLGAVSPGDAYRIYPFWTLGTIFPNGAGIVPSPSVAQKKTEVLFPDIGGVGINLSPNPTYFFLQNSSVTNWVVIGGGTSNANDTVILPDQYVVVRQQNNASTTTNVAIGQVPTYQIQIPLYTQTNSMQDNFIGLYRPSTQNLIQSGLSNGFQLSTIALKRDEVLVVPSGVEYNPAANQSYFLVAPTTNTDSGWRLVGGGNTDAGTSNVFLPGTGLIIRKAQTNVTSTVLWNNLPNY
jgi:uncharacterized protein (TIGR02597 family)